MSTIAIPYGTAEGQTARIAHYIGDVLRAHGHSAQLVDLGRSRDLDLDRYDAAVLGASVHMGKHERYVCDFIRDHLETLQRVPSAFFSVSLAAHGDLEQAEGYVEKLEQQTGWRPGHVGLFSGALRYTEYGFLKRHLMKRIAGSRPGGLGTDTSRDYVYTEWDGVQRFAEEFLQQLTAGNATASGG